MDWKRIGRAAVCLLVVCCLIFNMSPIKAKAVALEASLAVGLIAALIAGTAGVVFTLENTQQIQALGQSFQTHMYQWGANNNKQTEVQDWFLGLQFYDPSDGSEDDDDWVSPNKRKIGFVSGLMAGVSLWIASVILGDTVVEEEVETAPEGYMYYGSMCVKDVSSLVDMSVYPYVTIGYNDTSVFEYCLFSSQPLVVTKQWSYYGYFWRLSAVNDTDSLLYYNYNPASINDWYLHEKILDVPAGDRVTNFNAPVSGNDPFVKHELWTNYDLYGSEEFNFSQLLIPAGVPSRTVTAPVLPNTYVGDIPGQILDGTLEPGAIEFPNINYDALVEDGVSLSDSTIGTLHKLSTGELSYEAFLEKIKVESDSDTTTDPEPEPDPGTDPNYSTLADTQLGIFFTKLANIISTPFTWIWNEIKAFFDPLIKNASDIFEQIKALPDSFTSLTKDHLFGILDGIESIFVPTDDYLTSKVDELCVRYAFANSIVITAKRLTSAISDISADPPVIYIDLGASRGSYDIGGKVPILDMNWYSEYKPTVDKLLSSLLWICFAWRIFRKLPGIISGMPGDFAMAPLQLINIEDRLPRRSLEMANRRVEIAKTLRSYVPKKKG